MPIWWTQRIARVRGVIAAAMRGRVDVEAVRPRCRRRPARAPHWRMALAEAMKEWLTVITSSPGPTPTREQREVQRGRAVRDGAGVRGADRARRTPPRRRRPAAPASASRTGSTALAASRLLRARAGAGRSGSCRRRLERRRRGLGPPPGDQVAQPSSSGIVGREAERRCGRRGAGPAAAAPG